MTAFLPGFLLALSFIVAIGAQNAFVLRQGIRKEYVLLTVLTCCISEAALVSIGVAGFGIVTQKVPWIATAILYVGAAFVFFYGCLSFRSALTATEALTTEGQGAKSWRKVLLTCLAFTWLNPHTFLDTTFLIGSLSSQYGGDRWWFGGGAVAGACLFFFALGYGARLLAPIFANPRAWQVLDVIIGLTMWSIAFGLVFYG